MTQSFYPDSPHGYLRDSDGLVVIRFGNWPTDKSHRVPDVVDLSQTDYVEGAAAHTEAVADKYREQ